MGKRSNISDEVNYQTPTTNCSLYRLWEKMDVHVVEVLFVALMFCYTTCTEQYVLCELGVRISNRSTDERSLTNGIKYLLDYASYNLMLRYCKAMVNTHPPY